MQMHITLTLSGTRKSLLQLKISPLYSMTIHPKPNRALYCTLVGKSKTLTNTFALWLAFAPSSHHLMNNGTHVIMLSNSITSYA
jgi:hypothetical protein